MEGKGLNHAGKDKVVFRFTAADIATIPRPPLREFSWFEAFRYQKVPYPHEYLFVWDFTDGVIYDKTTNWETLAVAPESIKDMKGLLFTALAQEGYHNDQYVLGFYLDPTPGSGIDTMLSAQLTHAPSDYLYLWIPNLPKGEAFFSDTETCPELTTQYPEFAPAFKELFNHWEEYLPATCFYTRQYNGKWELSGTSPPPEDFP